MQKPEKCPYLTRNASLVVFNKPTRTLDYTNPNLISSTFSSLTSVNGCTLVAHADQGQGAWHSRIKTHYEQ
jgi:hypothetical protein